MIEHGKHLMPLFTEILLNFKETNGIISIIHMLIFSQVLKVNESK